ncbi:unnamed protein product, partial [Polarella glacialis]
MKHIKKYNARKGFGKADEPLTEEYESNGIYAGDGINGSKVGDFKCKFCPTAGPFMSLTAVDAHIKGKKHQKVVSPEPEPEVEDKGPPKDPFEDHLWNLPDYVLLASGTLTCQLCNSKSTTIKQMHAHLGGNAHAKKCRSEKKDDIIYVKERDRLEVLSSGRPVVRTGYKRPKASNEKKVEATSVNTSAPDASATGGGSGTSSALPDGWEEHQDPEGFPYFFNMTTQASTWDWPLVSEEAASAASSSKAATPSGGDLAAGVAGQTAVSGAGGATSSRAAAADRTSQGGSGTSSALPDGWEEHQDREGLTFYYNARTKASTWDRPLVSQEAASAASSSKAATPSGGDLAAGVAGQTAVSGAGGATSSRAAAADRLSQQGDLLLRDNLGRRSQPQQAHQQQQQENTDQQQQQQQQPQHHQQTQRQQQEHHRGQHQQNQQYQQREQQKPEQKWHQQQQLQPPPPTQQQSQQLPPGWRIEFHEGKPYYFDAETEESSWQPVPPYVHQAWGKR